MQSKIAFITVGQSQVEKSSLVVVGDKRGLSTTKGANSIQKDFSYT